MMYIAGLAFTLYSLKTGLLAEENPMIRTLLDHGLTAAAIFKLGLLAVFVAVVSLCFGVNSLLAVWVVALARFVYGLIVLWHLASLAIYIRVGTSCLDWPKLLTSSGEYAMVQLPGITK